MTYLSEVLSDSPNHYWRLADPGGLLASDIGSDPVTLVSSLSIPMIGYTGVSSTGGSYCSVSATTYWAPDSHLLADPFSAELWVWPLSRRAGGNQVLIEWDSGAFPFLNFQYLGTGVMRANIANHTLNDPTVRVMQHWYHLVATYSVANGSRFYVNGSQVATGAADGATSFAAAIKIGEDVGSLTSSVLTEVATYTHELSAARVAAHYAAQEVSSPPVYQLPASGASSPPGSLASDVTAIRDAVIRVKTTPGQA